MSSAWSYSNSGFVPWSNLGLLAVASVCLEIFGSRVCPRTSVLRWSFFVSSDSGHFSDSATSQDRMAPRLLLLLLLHTTLTCTVPGLFIISLDSDADQSERTTVVDGCCSSLLTLSPRGSSIQYILCAPYITRLCTSMYS